MTHDDEQRSVPLADVLSVTTPKLLSRQRMTGVCDLLDWMTDQPPTPRFMDRGALVRLQTAAQSCRIELIAQHPWLADLQPPEDLDTADLYAWLIEVERQHGEHVVVTRKGS